MFYFGAVAGGIWKTEDAGVTWTNVSDGYLNTSSVGALAVSDSDAGVIYAGMGESTIRADVSHGDGVYKSTDHGRSWVHAGLADTRHISEIRIHPRDPDRVYVAALGHAFGPHPDRGVYRSNDGGTSWEQVLRTSDRAGAADLALDVRNPSVLYASLWEVHRNFWELASGGPGSGLWRSTDGGDTWTDLRSRLPLPASAVLGKIGVAASPARQGRVWALIESDTDPGLYRSDDFGETWTLASDRQDLRYRPWYYMHVFADPRDEDTVYVNNLRMWKSTDAGAHFTPVPTPHGDNHDLWIDPRDNRRMIQGNDGGANVSFNAGASWSSIHNQLTAQLYTVDTDGRAPHYLVYGTQQDNSSIGVPSGTNDGAIAWGDCRVAGTGESGYVAVHPQDPDVVYIGAIGSSPGGAGALQRYDHRTGQARLVNVWPEHHGGMGPGELKYRFGWTFPIRFSPHDPNVLYAGGNQVFRSTDEGQSWEAISPDLTRAAPDKLGPSGGPITRDTSGAEHYCTLYAFAESPHEPGVLWAGSDDGLVHLSRNGGQSWRDVTPPDLPEWAFIRTVEPSPHKPATLYLAATRYKLDDPAPLSLQDRGLRRDLAGDHRHERRLRRSRAATIVRVSPGRSALPRGAVRRHRDRTLRLPRRRRHVAALAFELPGHPGLRSHGRGHGSRDRDPRAFVLDRRRPDSAATILAALRAAPAAAPYSYSPENGFRWSPRADASQSIRRPATTTRRVDDHGLLSRATQRMAPATGGDGLYHRHRRQGLQYWTGETRRPSSQGETSTGQVAAKLPRRRRIGADRGCSFTTASRTYVPGDGSATGSSLPCGSRHGRRAVQERNSAPIQRSSRPSAAAVAAAAADRRNPRLTRPFWTSAGTGSP